MPRLIVLVGAPGSGKSTLAHSLIYEDGDHGAMTVYVNQDSQGRWGHQSVFFAALERGDDIIVDRMGFNRQQRERYLKPAKQAGYTTKIIKLNTPKEVCLERALKRENHETVKTAEDAHKAINFFFNNYEEVGNDEADEVKIA